MFLQPFIHFKILTWHVGRVVMPFFLISAKKNFNFFLQTFRKWILIQFFFFFRIPKQPFLLTPQTTHSSCDELQWEWHFYFVSDGRQLDTECTGHTTQNFIRHFSWISYIHMRRKQKKKRHLYITDKGLAFRRIWEKS